MPAASDLFGTRFGALLIIARAPNLGGRQSRWWLTRCDCGAEELYPQRRLTHDCRTDRVRACSACEAPCCTVCDRKLAGRTTKRVCDREECRIAKRRDIGNSSYHRIYADPARAARCAEAAAARKRQARVTMKSGEVAEDTRRRAERLRRREEADPRLAEERRARARQSYAKLAEETQRRRRERLERMTPEQLAQWIERVRTYGRSYRQRWRAELAGDPAKHQAYLDQQAECRRRRRLLRLMSQARGLAEDAR